VKLSRWSLILIVLIVIVLFAGWISLDFFPAYGGDDAWNASRALSWLETGRNYTTIDGDLATHYEGYWTFYPLVPTLLLAGAIDLAGLSRFAVRAVSMGFGLGLLLAVYSISVSLSRSRRCGLIAGLLLVTSLPFVLSSHVVRPDIYVAALGYGAIALYYLARGGTRLRSICLAFLSGLLIGLGFEMHPNAAYFVPVVLTLYLIDDGLGFVRRARFWAFAAGLVVALAFYAWVHILPYPQTYAALTRIYGASRVPPILSGSLFAIADQIRLATAQLAPLMSLRFIAVLAVLPVVSLRRREPITSAVAMLAVSLVVFLLLTGGPLPVYAILFSPLCDVILALWLTKWLDERQRANALTRVLRSVSVLCVTLSLVVLAGFVWTGRDRGDAARVSERMREIVQPGAVIMGNQLYWFGVPEFKHLSPFWIAYEHYYYGTDVEAVMERMRPDFLIADDSWRRMVTPDSPGTGESCPIPYLCGRSLPQQAVQDLLARRARLVSTIPTSTYGAVDVYAFDWTAAP
jgi:4-amino-4-deoxy-L-arabinose transferase-like glycosyltransferase